MKAEESKTGAKLTPQSALDKKIWLVGMAIAIMLIIINLMSFLPTYIDRANPIIVRDFGNVAISIYHKAAMFGIGTTIYLCLLAILAHFMARLGMKGVSRAIYIILCAKLFSFISNAYGWYTGAFQVGVSYADSTYFYVNAVISIISYLASTCVYFYVAAMLLTYKRSLRRYLRPLAVFMMLSLGFSAVDLAVSAPQLIPNLEKLGIEEYSDYFHICFQILFIVRGIIRIFEYYILYIIFNKARKKEYFFSSKKS